MSQSQPSFVRGDDIDPTNESQACKDTSVPISSSSSFSSSLHPSSITTNSSVLLQGLHDSHPHHHKASQVFQKLSLLDNQKSDTSTPMTRRKLPLSRLPTSSSRANPKHEKKVKKPVSRKKHTPLKFKFYRHPGAMAAITSALEALDTNGDDSTDAQAVNGLDDSLVIRLKYKSPETATTTSTTDEHAINSPIQHQRVANQDIMRITSVLNDSAQTMPSSRPPSFNSPITASNANASPSSSSSQPSPLNVPDRYPGYSNTDILDPADACSQIAKSGLRNEYIDMLSHPDRQRYEDALVKIVGDLELPFLGTRYGSRRG